MALGECATFDSGWAKQAFSATGDHLEVSMERLTGHADLGVGPEEMIAVLQGMVQLKCDDEVHRLEAGQGALISAGVNRQIETADSALVYRVRRQ